MDFDFTLCNKLMKVINQKMVLILFIGNNYASLHIYRGDRKVTPYFKILIIYFL